MKFQLAVLLVVVASAAASQFPGHKFGAPRGNNDLIIKNVDQFRQQEPDRLF